jgi:hypothetical protein
MEQKQIHKGLIRYEKLLIFIKRKGVRGEKTLK